MDEKLLTGRFSVEPDFTRRGLTSPPSPKSNSSSRVHSATTSAGPSTRNNSASSRPRSVSRPNSREGALLKRSKSAFEVALFKSQLRLNKTLSWKRFRPEHLDFDLHPDTASTSFPNEAGGAGGGDGGRGEESRSSSDQHAEEKGQQRDRDDTDGHNAENDPMNDNDEDGDAPVSAESPRHQTKLEQALSSGDTVDGRERARPKTRTPEFGIEWTRFFHQKSEAPTADSRQLSPDKRRAEMCSGLSLARGEIGSPITMRDGSIVKYPHRSKQADAVTLKLRSLGVGTSPSKSLQRRGSDSSASEDDRELADLTDASPSGHVGRGGHSRSDAKDKEGGGEGETTGYSSDDDQYDTDCEVDEESDFNRRTRHETASRLNTDIGHLTYGQACARLGIVPSQSVLRQLPTQSLRVNHAGFSTMDAKALALALLHNTRLEEVDLANNGLTGPGIAYIADCLQRNSFITKLSLSGNHVQTEGAMALAEMLKVTVWLTHLNLSDCNIADDEIEYLSKGIQENASVVCLNLSKNKIETKGGRVLATALGINSGIECLNLSWNLLRGGGAVAVCNSLQRNNTISELNLAWNGLGFEGSLALSEALKTNRSLTKVNISNNRVDWDCVPYIARALLMNRYLEVLEMGHNPVSMEGCLKLLEAIDKPLSRIRILSLTDVPINTKIAFKATEISKKREFTMEHGGIITTREVLGIKRVKREDPLSLLIRYLTTMGIRVVDLFRMFDTDSRLYVSQANFIRGLKRVRAPLDEEDMLRVARRMRSDKRGDISYQELAANVRSRIREDIKEDRRLQIIEFKKRESRKRILQSDLPLHAPSSFAYLPALYNMYGSRVSGRGESCTPGPSMSRRGSVAFHHRTPTNGFLPRIGTAGRKNSTVGLVVSPPNRKNVYTPGNRVRLPNVEGGSDYHTKAPEKAGPSGYKHKSYDANDYARKTPPSMANMGGRKTPRTLVNSGVKGLPGVSSSHHIDAFREGSAHHSRLRHQDSKRWDYGDQRRM